MHHNRTPTTGRDGVVPQPGASVARVNTANRIVIRDVNR
jgi:hypothetical protein